MAIVGEPFQYNVAVFETALVPTAHNQKAIEESVVSVWRQRQHAPTLPTSNISRLLLQQYVMRHIGRSLPDVLGEHLRQVERLLGVRGDVELRDERHQVQHGHGVEVLDEHLEDVEHRAAAVLQLTRRPHAVHVTRAHATLHRQQVQNHLTLLYDLTELLTDYVVHVCAAIHESELSFVYGQQYLQCSV